jgi:hypothetical protein
MDKFEYKVLWNKRAGVFAEHWFDGDKDLGSEITSDLLAPFGQEGWEVVATMQMVSGPTHKIILKRRSKPVTEITR